MKKVYYFKYSSGFEIKRSENFSTREEAEKQQKLYADSITGFVSPVLEEIIGGANNGTC